LRSVGTAKLHIWDVVVTLFGHIKSTDSLALRTVLPAHIFICVVARAELAHQVPEITDRPGHVHPERSFRGPRF
jgi:hypothetical protein